MIGKRVSYLGPYGRDVFGIIARQDGLGWWLVYVGFCSYSIKSTWITGLEEP